MKVDGRTTALMLDNAIASARNAEDAGYDGLWASELGQDPFLPLLLAAEHSSRIQIGTGVAVGFARNPMTLAQSAYDMHKFSGGRFILGLGSQVKAHITRRYSMEWSHPAARMREMVSAIRHILEAWQGLHPMHFEGEFYTHTLMTPYFDPGPNPHGIPPIFVAGVGDLMTKVAGEVGDGLLCHGFTTEAYLREVTVPALAQGRATSGKTLDGFEVSLFALVATGRTAEEMAEAVAAVRRRIALYGSTPTYRAVLEHHGWGELQTTLNAMSKENRWDEMGELIDDTMLHAFAVVGEPGEIAARLHERFGDVVARISYYAPYDSATELWNAITADIKRLG